jgi:hypothetical protein
MFTLSPCYTARLKIEAFMFCGDIVNQSKGMRYIAFKARAGTVRDHHERRGGLAEQNAE